MWEEWWDFTLSKAIHLFEQGLLSFCELWLQSRFCRVRSSVLQVDRWVHQGTWGPFPSCVTFPSVALCSLEAWERALLNSIGSSSGSSLLPRSGRPCSEFLSTFPTFCWVIKEVPWDGMLVALQVANCLHFQQILVLSISLSSLVEMGLASSSLVGLVCKEMQS